MSANLIETMRILKSQIGVQAHPDMFTGELHNARRKELEQAACSERIAKGPMGVIDDIVGTEAEPLPVRRQKLGVHVDHDIHLARVRTYS